MIKYLDLKRINDLYDAEIRKTIGDVPTTKVATRASTNCKPPSSMSNCVVWMPTTSAARTLLPVTERIHAQELSIPCHQALTDEETGRVVALLNAFK